MISVKQRRLAHKLKTRKEQQDEARPMRQVISDNYWEMCRNLYAIFNLPMPVSGRLFDIEWAIQFTKFYHDKTLKADRYQYRMGSILHSILVEHNLYSNKFTVRIGNVPLHRTFDKFHEAVNKVVTMITRLSGHAKHLVRARVLEIVKSELVISQLSNIGCIDIETSIV